MPTRRRHQRLAARLRRQLQLGRQYHADGQRSERRARRRGRQRPRDLRGGHRVPQPVDRHRRQRHPGGRRHVRHRRGRLGHRSPPTAASPTRRRSASPAPAPLPTPSPIRCATPASTASAAMPTTLPAPARCRSTSARWSGSSTTTPAALRHRHAGRSVHLDRSIQRRQRRPRAARSRRHHLPARRHRHLFRAPTASTCSTARPLIGAGEALTITPTGGGNRGHHLSGRHRADHPGDGRRRRRRLARAEQHA